MVHRPPWSPEIGSGAGPEPQMRKCQGTLGETQVTLPTLAKIGVKGHEDTGFLWTVSPRICTPGQLGEERASFLCSLAPASQACKDWQMAECGYQGPRGPMFVFLLNFKSSAMCPFQNNDYKALW